MTKSKKEYSEDQINAIIKMKKAFPKSSIRELSKLSGVPKSVVGRWIKNPDLSIQKTEVRELKRELTGVQLRKVKGRGNAKPQIVIKKDKSGKPISKRKSIQHFFEKVMKNPKGSQSRLRVKRASRDDAGNLIDDPSGEEWIAISGY